MASIIDKRRQQWIKDHPPYMKYVDEIGWCCAGDVPSKEIVDVWIEEETYDGIALAKKLGRYIE